MSLPSDEERKGEREIDVTGRLKTYSKEILSTGSHRYHRREDRSTHGLIPSSDSGNPNQRLGE